MVVRSIKVSGPTVISTKSAHFLTNSTSKAVFIWSSAFIRLKASLKSISLPPKVKPIFCFCLGISLGATIVLISLIFPFKTLLGAVIAPLTLVVIEPTHR